MVSSFVKEDPQINTTTVCLSMVSLLSEIEKASLIQIVGSEEEFLKLSELDIIILSSALNNGEISNTFIQQRSMSIEQTLGISSDIW